MKISKVTNCAVREEREWDAQTECAGIAEEAGVGEDGGRAAARDDHVQGLAAVSTRCVVCISEIYYTLHQMCAPLLSISPPKIRGS